MNQETIKKLAALCIRWDALDKERTEIEAQIAQLTAPPASQPAEDDEIRVGDLVKVVKATHGYTYESDVGRGGYVTKMDPDGCLHLNKAVGLAIPVAMVAYGPDCRKVKRS